MNFDQQQNDAVFSNKIERAFRKSARKRPFVDRFNTVQEVLLDLEKRGLSDSSIREYVARTYA